MGVPIDAPVENLVVEIECQPRVVLQKRNPRTPKSARWKEIMVSVRPNAEVNIDVSRIVLIAIVTKLFFRELKVRGRH